MRKIFSIGTAIMLSVFAMQAGVVDDARELYASGDVEGAVVLLQDVLKKSPKDKTANYELGVCYYLLGDFSKAKTAFKAAETAGYGDAARYLAVISMQQYDFDAAYNAAERWGALLAKAEQSEDPAETMQQQIMQAKNMLERVEKIAIVDTIRVDADEFFKHYRLSPETGKLENGTVLPLDLNGSASQVVYCTENGKEMFWSQKDEDGFQTIVTSDILDDGTVDTPRTVSDILNEGGDADYPFVMNDGYTIYFANNGENSIGGYDIFMTRRSPDGEVLQPQNVGMPYNSPFNDFMMVYDEANNLGWFASDREQIPGKVTIYVFVPSKVRQNYDPEDENIKNYAKLEGVTVTGDLDARLTSKAPAKSPAIEFLQPMGNGKVYTRLADFKNPQARQAMEQLLDKKAEYDKACLVLDGLRADYARGSRNEIAKIKKTEQDLLTMQTELSRLTNKVISLEK